MTAQEPIAAVILAAGRSSRMGRVKMALPWGNTTVIGKVVSTLSQAGVEEMVVVTGGAQAQVEPLLNGLPARPVHNPDFMKDAMVLSLQAGLRALSGESAAVLVALGDQPQIEADVARRVMECFFNRRASLVVPSYQMRRGHPWLAARHLWPDLLAIQPPATTRTFLNAHSAEIEYLVVDSDSILRDLDTPEDYARERPASTTAAHPSD